MTLIEDDTLLHPEIAADTRLYIDSLDEGHEAYTRFFDALLVKRTQHRSFYCDLKAFRAQPRVIYMLSGASIEKQRYREITIVFLESRFAHPWCRQTPMKKAFWRAEWGNIHGKARDADTQREEQRLHKLLLPIWIIMRSRMFPGDELVAKWCKAERQRRAEQPLQSLTAFTLEKHDSITSQRPVTQGAIGPNADSDDGQSDAQAAAVASRVFRLAAAGMIISQTPKRKLRWLTKAQN